MSYFPKFDEIKEFRIKLNITQSELAKAIGVSTNMIGQIETDRAKPSAENYKKIFEYLFRKSDEKEIKLEEIWATPLIFLTPGKTAQDAKEIFESEKDIELLPVLTNDKDRHLLGKITKKVLLEYLEKNNREANRIMIQDILEESPVTVPHDTPKTQITKFLEQNNCVLVTKNGKITGIVNYWDHMMKP